MIQVIMWILDMDLSKSLHHSAVGGMVLGEILCWIAFSNNK